MHRMSETVHSAPIKLRKQKQKCILETQAHQIETKQNKQQNHIEPQHWSYQSMNKLKSTVKYRFHPEATGWHEGPHFYANFSHFMQGSAGFIHLGPFWCSFLHFLCEY